MLLSLPPETIEKVVTFLTAQVSIGGPPPNLYALMRTCRYMYYLLSPEHNPGMFYRLFRDYFDLAAPRRRLPSVPCTPAQFSQEACQRFASLKLVRKKDVNHPDISKSLLVAYVMILEDDGKNSMHLQWADLDTFLNIYLTQKSPDLEDYNTWSLAMILRALWMLPGAFSAAR